MKRLYQSEIKKKNAEYRKAQSKPLYTNSSLIRKIVNLKKRKTWKEIATILNEQGFKTPDRGKPLTAKNVSNIYYRYKVNRKIKKHRYRRRVTKERDIAPLNKTY